MLSYRNIPSILFSSFTTRQSRECMCRSSLENLDGPGGKSWKSRFFLVDL